MQDVKMEEEGGVVSALPRKRVRERGSEGEGVSERERWWLGFLLYMGEILGQGFGLFLLILN